MSDRILAARRAYLEALDTFTDAFATHKDKVSKRQESAKAARSRAGEEATRHGASPQVARRLRGES
jgi:hypothetical protein